MTRLLVVDDDPQILRTLRINLRARGYDVDVAADGTTALRLATARHPDLLLLDLGLPDTDGVDVITNLRTWTTTPIIVLSGRSGSTDKVEALDAGADDYVTKPFGIDELLARIRAATRRTLTTSTVPAVKIGRHTIDLTDRQVRDDGGNPVRLTPTEWRILEILATSPGKLISQTQLLTQVWGPTYTHETHYLRQYIAQLRRKLEADPSRPHHLLTELGMGYRLQEGD